jgi:uncharacterized protein
MKNTSYYTLITGGSKGIGFELAKEFAKNGHNIILVARSSNELEEKSKELTLNYQVSVQYIVADLKLDSEIDKLKTEIDKKKYKINILINNAGYGLVGPFEQLSLKDQMEMIDLNVKALVNLSYYFIEKFKDIGFGRILNVSSTASFLEGPFMNVYYSSKHFVTSFSLGLSKELEKSGILISCLCPGYTRSDFHKVSGGEKLPMLQKFMKLDDPEKLATITYNDFINKNKNLIIPFFHNKLLIALLPLIPRSVKLKLINLLQHPNQ